MTLFEIIYNIKKFNIKISIKTKKYCDINN